MSSDSELSLPYREAPEVPSWDELLATFSGPPPEAQDRSKWLWHAIGALLHACSPAPAPAPATESTAEELQVLGFGTIKRQLALHVLPFYPKCHLYRVRRSPCI